MAPNPLSRTCGEGLGTRLFSHRIYPAALFKGLILLVNILYTTMHHCPNNTLN